MFVTATTSTGKAIRRSDFAWTATKTLQIVPGFVDFARTATRTFQIVPKLANLFGTATRVIFQHRIHCFFHSKQHRRGLIMLGQSPFNSIQQLVTINRVAGAKWGSCSGQACIAIDYLLVEEKFAPLLVDLLKAKIKKLYNEPENAARIAHRQHFQRLSNFLNDTAVAASVVYGGSLNVESLLIEPTILLDPPLDSEIMREEIFGPLLPIITLKKIEDSIEFLKERPKPLVIYAFTVDEKLKRRIVEETSSGSITFNDTLVQFAIDSLPFGGTGESGFGKYHGKFSFDQFSNGKAILRRSLLIEISSRYPPWNEWKLQFIRYFYSFHYIGVLLMLLGLKR